MHRFRRKSRHLANSLATALVTVLVGVTNAWAVPQPNLAPHLAPSCAWLFTESPIQAGDRVKLATNRDQDEIVHFIRLQRQRLGLDPERGADGRSTIADVRAFDNAYGAGQGRFFTVSDEKGLVGTIAYTRVAPSACELKRIYLDERAQGRGQGRRLVEMAIQTARAEGYTNVILQTRPELSDALRLYEKLGFQKDVSRSSGSVYFYSLAL